MKTFKLLVFVGLIWYWVVSMDEYIKGEGLFVSALGIIILIAFIYGAYLFFYK